MLTFYQGMEVIVPDTVKLSLPGLSESKSVGTFSNMQNKDGYRGLFVDRGVGSPRLMKSSSASTFPVDLKLDSESKVCEGSTLLSQRLLRMCIFQSNAPSETSIIVFFRTLCQLLQELLQPEL